MDKATCLRDNPTNWKEINALNVEVLMTLTERFENQELLDACIIWILKEMIAHGFQLSEMWKQENPELTNEINTLFKMVAGVQKIDLKQGVSVMLKGKNYFEKLEKIKRFSGLQVYVDGTVNPPPHNTPLVDRMKRLMRSGYQHVSKSIMVKSLHFYPKSDQSELFFLANNVSYPFLKELILDDTNLSNLKKLSEALIHQKMPKLEILKLSKNSRIRLTNFELTQKIALKRLYLRFNRLKNIKPLAKMLNDDKIPHLELLNLFGNPDIQLNSIKKEMLEFLIGQKRLIV
jgi:hypothetical protein